MSKISFSEEITDEHILKTTMKLFTKGMFLLQLFFQSKDSAGKIIQRTKSENSPAEVCQEEEISLESK